MERLARLRARLLRVPALPNVRPRDEEALRGTVGQKGFGRSVVDAPAEEWAAHVASLRDR